MAYEEHAIKRLMVSDWDRQFKVGREVVQDDTKIEKI